MVSYSFLEEAPARASPAPPAPPMIPQRQFGPLKIRSDCDYIVLAFVIGTLILLISDMSK